MGRIQLLCQEPVDLHPYLIGLSGVHAVKGMPPGNVLVDLVLKGLVLGLQGIDQVFHLQHIDIFIVGVGMDQKGRILHLMGIPGR